MAHAEPGSDRNPTYLDNFIPPRADNDRVLVIGTKPHTANPLGVTLISDCEFAVSECIPQLDRTIP